LISVKFKRKKKNKPKDKEKKKEEKTEEKKVEEAPAPVQEKKEEEKPVEITTEKKFEEEDKKFKCTSCKDAAFETNVLFKAHFKTDWHNFNNKRKVDVIPNMEFFYSFRKSPL
jgi:hypothetical protein